MKLNFFAVTLLASFLILISLCLLNRQNDIASNGKEGRGYLDFNRAKQADATVIMQYWKAAPARASAVKKMIIIDYAFMIVYCLYLSFAFLYFRRRTQSKFLKTLFGLGFIIIIIATVIDAIQDWKIYHFVSSSDVVQDMRTYTRVKWYALIIVLAIFVIAIFPKNFFKAIFWKGAIRYLSQLFKSLWLFFPGILFLLLPVFCFWSLGQGKDIIADFINIKGEPHESTSHFDHTRLLFFIGIAFWAYVSWYSARIIAYIKKTRQERDMENVNKDHDAAEKAYNDNAAFFEIGKTFLDDFPRGIGNCCFLVLEIAIFKSSIIKGPITSLAAWLFFAWAIVSFVYINKWVETTQSKKAGFRKTFWGLMIAFGLATIMISFTGMTIWGLFIMLLFLHVVFIFYINLRRVMMEEDAKTKLIRMGNDRTRLERVMDYFCVPRKESGYFRWFLIICIIGIGLYLYAIFNLRFSRSLGPFPFIILAFAVLLAFGNIVTAFSVRYKLNFHFILLLLAFLLGLKETHHVRTFELKENAVNGYNKKPKLKEYLSAWLNERLDSTDSRYDMYFVLSNGGASRSGYWTAAVLGKIEDASLKDSLPGRFSDHIFCLSGTSGGGVGVAAFFSLLRDKQQRTDTLYSASAVSFLKQDYFTYTFARMLGPDFFNYIFHAPLMDDRAGALESSFEISASDGDSKLYKVPFNDNFSSFPVMKNGKTFLPVLFVNTTRMQDGNPGVVTNLDLEKDLFNSRIDLVKLLDSNRDMSITTASILGARFPYLSPAGRLQDSYFVDGGYFDNSGAGAVQERSGVSLMKQKRIRP